MAPVLRAAESIRKHPEFVNSRDKLIPDVAVYADWFSRADVERRRLAVGAKRYSLATNLLGYHPSWEMFADPEDGRLLTLDELQAENVPEREQRMMKVRAIMNQRRRYVGAVATWGFAPT